MSKKTARNIEELWIFHALRLPGRLEADETAARLGFPIHSIPILIGGGLLKPLGKPSAKSSKKFASEEIETLARDRKWLDRATRMVDDHWVTANKAKKLRTSISGSAPLTNGN